jgi:hypothetical protein
LLTSRAGRFFIGICSLLVYSVAICDDAKTSVPKAIGGLPYKTVKKYEEDALGLSLSYQGDGATLTVFLYRGGIPEIPPGINSEVFTAQFAQARKDIEDAKTWTNVRLISDAPVMLGSRNLKIRKAVFEVSVGETPHTTILYLTAARNHFYKARLTGQKGNPVIEGDRLAAVERDLGDLITGWITQ